MHAVHNKKLDLNLLLPFDALLREQNVTRAAESLGLSQSAMSHALRRLRDFYNDDLFVRVGDGMKPTPYAEHLARSVEDVLHLVRGSLTTEAVFDPIKANRVFSIFMSDMGEVVFLPKLIKHLQEKAPGCRIKTIQVPTEKIPEKLENGEIDLALGTSYVISQGVFQQELFHHSFTCLVSPHSTLTDRDLNLEKYLDMKHVCVMLSDKSTPYDSVVEEMGLKRDIQVTTPHFVVLPMILEGNLDFITTVPLQLGKVFSRVNMVKMLDPPIELPTFPLRQYWHPRYHRDPANIWLRQQVKMLFDGFNS
ncbi:LysR family transcriptional regulator [Marinobacterium lutimaris]|uniref:Transcriptional regulator, LysR family n=1 Tax=Marinobacterium lutimaris TaxID=568106 RepID=A0A1H5WIW3_9GAMM|nr:LysR family transcriptional regulator [Marinobacterium lutimaris]SEF99315.1 transcriptional regulator, LysR family [Marinobacterium lutimaris]